MGNFPNLTQLFGDTSMLAPQLGLDQFNQAQNGEMLDQAKGLQDMFLNHEMNPLKVQQRQLENEQIPVQTQGFMFDNQRKELDNQFTRDTQAGKINATNLENSIAPEKVAQQKAMLQAEAWLRDPNPAIRKLGEDIIQHSKPVLEDKYKEGYKADRQLGAIRETGAQQRQTEQMRIEAGKYKKSNTSGAGASLQDALTSGKLTYEKADTMISNHVALLGLKLQAAETPEEAAQLQQEISYWTQYGQQVAQKVLDAKGAASAAPRAGTPDLPALNVPANPSRPAPAISVPGAASAAPAPAAPQYAKNPSTGERIMSTDGGKTWKKAE